MRLCGIGEYVTNRSIIFPQYDLSRKKNPLKEFSKCCLLLEKRHRLPAGRGGGTRLCASRERLPSARWQPEPAIPAGLTEEPLLLPAPPPATNHLREWGLSLLPPPPSPHAPHTTQVSLSSFSFSLPSPPPLLVRLLFSWDSDLAVNRPNTNNMRIYYCTDNY